MKSSLSKSKEKRDIIAKSVQLACSVVIEKDEDTIGKLLSGQPYDKQDILNYAQTLLLEGKHIHVLQNLEDFDTILQNVELEASEPLFIIYGTMDYRWTITCIVNDEAGETNILYNDPSGIGLYIELEQKLKKKFEVEKIFENSCQQQNTYLSGPQVLRNIYFFLVFLQRTKTNIGEEFQKLRFCHFEVLQKDKRQKIIDLSEDLTLNTEFKIAFSTLLSKIPVSDIFKLMRYEMTVKDVIKAGENSIRGEKLQQEKKKYLNDENKLFELPNELNLVAKDIDFETSIQIKFPKEMKKVNCLFQILDTMQTDQEFNEILGKACQNLGVEMGKIKFLYDLKPMAHKTKSQTRIAEENSAASLFPFTKEEEEEKEKDYSFEELLQQIKFFEDKNDEKLEWLKKMCENYEHWNKDLSWYTPYLKNFAKVGKYLLDKNPDYVAIILVFVSIAYHINTEYSLRNNQILAILYFFQFGQLCEIPPGGGKIEIVVGLSIIKVLQGYKVDIIFNTQMVAQRDMEEAQKVYKFFGITCSCNSDPEIVYQADVAYGTMSSFQYQYLQDAFTGIRRRKLEYLIIDEIDTLVIDEGGNATRIADSNSVMDSLKYVYIKIWEELHQAEDSISKEVEDELQELSKDWKASRKFQDEKNEWREKIKRKMKESNPTEHPLIKGYLKVYADYKLETWIDNALIAKNECHLWENYTIEKIQGEKVIVPVHNLNGGISVESSLRVSGLVQFLQLKHNLRLTLEDLTLSTISNLGYINLFDKKNICGMTGYLGSEAERQLFKELYDMEYTELPPYRKRKFQEIDGLVEDDQKWHQAIINNVFVSISKHSIKDKDNKVTGGRRGVLVICETEKDVQKIKQNFDIINSSKFLVRVHKRTSHEKVRAGEVILISNTHVQCPNFKISKKVKKNGGLHVIVAFLPVNLRVERQNFGRAGNKGTGQLIIRRSEVEKFGITSRITIEAIKKARDEHEAERIVTVKEKLMMQLKTEDKFLAEFTNLYRNYLENRPTAIDKIVLQDLRQFWAFWYETRESDFTSEEFWEKTREILDHNKIIYNPVNWINLAHHYLDNGLIDEAKSALENCLEMEQGQLLVGSYLKFFEVGMYGGYQLGLQLKNVATDPFLLQYCDQKPLDSYKQLTLDLLEKAKTTIMQEIDFIETHLTDANSNFIKIALPTEENPFLKNIYSRLGYLKIYKDNIKTLGEKLLKGGEFALNGKINFDLYIPGLSELFGIQKVKSDIPQENILKDEKLIATGLKLLAICSILPLLYRSVSKAAKVFISCGVADLVLEVLYTEENKNDYLHSKLTNYIINEAPWGNVQTIKSRKFLILVLKSVQESPIFINRNKNIKELSKQARDTSDNILDRLKIVSGKERFDKTAKAEQFIQLKQLEKNEKFKLFEALGGEEKIKELEEFTKHDTLYDFLRPFVSPGRENKESFLQKRVTQPLQNILFESVQEEIREICRKKLAEEIRKNEEVMAKLRNCRLKNIEKSVECFKKDEDGFKILMVLGKKLLDKLNQTAEEFIIDGLEEFGLYCNAFIFYIENKLEEDTSENNVDEIIEIICEKLLTQMFVLFADMIQARSIGLKLDFWWSLNVDLAELGSSQEPKDPYKILNLPKDASFEEINEQWRNMALVLHPKNNRYDPLAEKKYDLVKNAYDTIGLSLISTHLVAEAKKAMEMSQ